MKPKEYILTKNDINKIFSLDGINTSLSSCSHPFTNKFLEVYIQKYPEQKEVQDFYNKSKMKRDDILCHDFGQFFDNKISLPNDWFFLFLFPCGYSHNERDVLQFIGEKLDESSFLKMLEKSVFYKPTYEQTKLWFDLAQKNIKDIDLDKTEKIILNQCSSLCSSHSTHDKTRALKYLCFLHQFKDQTKTIEDFLTKSQKDALFIQRAAAVLKKNKIDIHLKDKKEIDIVLSHSIQGTLSINPEYFISTYGFTRKKSEEYIEYFLNSVQSLNKNVYKFSKMTMNISAPDVETYSKAEDWAKKTLINFCKLAKYWNSNYKQDPHTFFKTYLQNIEIFEELEKNLSSKQTSLKKNKI